MQRYREMREIMSAEQPEIDKMWSAFEDALNDQFIMSASENGLKRWETNVGVIPKDTDTIEERRFRVLTRLNQELPYTLVKLKETLTTLCGEDQFRVDVQAAKYHISIKLALSSASNYQEVVNILSTIIPANMTQSVEIMFNAHSIFGRFKHSEMAAYTHNQLRSEVFDNGN
jgi:hypothetical protein